jgi:hypothetical protein
MSDRIHKTALFGAVALLAVVALGCPGEKTVPPPTAAQPPPNEVWVEASQTKEAGIVPDASRSPTSIWDTSCPPSPGGSRESWPS